MPIIVIVVPVVDYFMKKKKSGNKNAVKRKKKSSVKSRKDYIDEFSSTLSESGQKKIIDRDLNLKGKKKTENQETEKAAENKTDGLKGENYNFKDTTDNLVEEIKKERKELREKEITRAKENEFKPSFEISIEDELDSYDLANAVILKEILDKPVALRRDD